MQFIVLIADKLLLRLSCWAQLNEQCLSFVQSILPVPYFASERSFAQFRLPEETRAVVGFGQRSDVILIASAQGSFYTASFDPARGGSCTQQSFHKFVDVDQQRH